LNRRNDRLKFESSWDVMLRSLPARGYRWVEKSKRYEAFISDKGKSINLGSYKSQEEARDAVAAFRLERFKRGVVSLGLSDAKCATTHNYYVVFETGQILNAHGAEMTGHVDWCGYREVVLDHQICRVHRVVAEAFIPNPQGKRCVNHKDGNKLNNNVSNLEWVTYSENTTHAFKTGLEIPQCGEEHHAHKLTWDTVREIRATYKPRDHVYGAAAIAKRLGVDRSTIRAIVNNECWREENEV
jgi:hypothetical protein